MTITQNTGCSSAIPAETGFYKLADRLAEECIVVHERINRFIETWQREREELATRSFSSNFPKFSPLLSIDLFRQLLCHDGDGLAVKTLPTASKRDILNFVPFRNEFAIQSSWVNGEGKGAIVFGVAGDGSVVSEIVRQNYKFECNHLGFLSDEHLHTPGESVAGAIKRMGIKGPFAVLVFEDSDYCRNSPFVGKHIDSPNLSKKIKPDTTLFLSQAG